MDEANTYRPHFSQLERWGFSFLTAIQSKFRISCEYYVDYKNDNG